MGEIGTGVAQRIDNLRNDLKLSKSEISKIMGFSSSYYSAILSEAKKVNLIHLVRLAEQTNVNLNWLLTGEGNMKLMSVVSEDDLLHDNGGEYTSEPTKSHTFPGYQEVHKIPPRIPDQNWETVLTERLAHYSRMLDAQMEHSRLLMLENDKFEAEIKKLNTEIAALQKQLKKKNP